MDFQNKKQLQKSVLSFLNQRVRAYKVMFARTNEAEFILKSHVANKIKAQWQMIHRYDYWRHCREVILQEENLHKILPSPNGHHRSIREHMMELIEHCRNVQKMPAEVYRNKELV